MNNAEVIRGIEMTIEGLTTIKSALGVAEKTTPVEVEEKPVMNAPVEEKKDDSAQQTTGDIPDEKTLGKMKYNEFKKYAAELGVKCTGTRAEIMKRILALKNGEVPAEEAPVEETPKKVVKKSEDKSDSVSTSKRKLAKKVEEPTKDEFDKQAEEIAKETDVADIIDALADVDIKANEKNYLEKLAEALRKGLLEAEGDDEDESDETETTEEETSDESDEVEESDEDETDDETDDSEEDDSDEESDYEEDDIESDSYFKQYDPEGVNDPDDMSDKRKDAILSKMDKILTDVSEGKLTTDNIESYIENHATQDEIDLLGEEYSEDDELELYMELVKRTIDDDGEEHEQSDPYEIGGENFCCGHKLKFMKETGNYYCEQCGTEYEAE